MADISKLTFNPAKNYRKVIFQYGRPFIDFEANELQKILRYVQVQGSRGALGNAPASDGLLLRPTTPAGPTVEVLPGVFFNYGKPVEVPTLQEATTLAGVIQTNETTNVYLVWSEIEISSNIDNDILDPDIGRETSKRLQLAFEVATHSASDQLYIDDNQEAIFLGQVEQANGGSTTLTDNEITDYRFEYNQNYVVEGFDVVSTTTGFVNLSEGSGIVQNAALTFDNSTAPLAADSFNYIWIDSTGALQVTSAKPAPPAILLYEVTVAENPATSQQEILEIIDLRRWAPPLNGYNERKSKDFISSNRELYYEFDPIFPGEVTTSVTNEVLATINVLNDPDNDYGIEEIGIFVRASAGVEDGEITITVDSNTVGVFTIPQGLASTSDWSLVHVNFPVDQSFVTEDWSDTAIHTVQVLGRNPDATSTRVHNVHVYVKVNNGNSKVLHSSAQVPNDVASNTVVHTGLTPTVARTAVVYHDPVDGIGIKRLHWAADSLMAVGDTLEADATLQIYVDGILYDEVAAEPPLSGAVILGGNFPVNFAPKTFHQVELRIFSAFANTSITNTHFDLYVEQD